MRWTMNCRRKIILEEDKVLSDAGGANQAIRKVRNAFRTFEER